MPCRWHRWRASRRRGKRLEARAQVLPAKPARRCPRTRPRPPCLPPAPLRRPSRLFWHQPLLAAPCRHRPPRAAPRRSTCRATTVPIPTPPADTINADAAAVAPLGKAGIIFQAPPVGVGVLTIKGVLAANDTIDLTNALAGTTWNHQPGTMWNYMSETASPSGCVISVGGKPVVLLPNGSPNGNIGPFITAH